jgi:hypothetical protein
MHFPHQLRKSSDLGADKFPPITHPCNFQVAEGEFEEGSRIAFQAKMTAGQMFEDSDDIEEAQQQQEQRQPQQQELAQTREVQARQS